VPRIDIELTSSQPDGTWTWRAAGARQPKGVLDGALLDPGARTGDVLRAECEVDLDGTRVTSVVPSRTKRADPERLTLLGSGREAPLVTQDGGAPDMRERPGRDGRRDGRPERRPGRDGGDRQGAGGRPGARGPGGRPAAERARSGGDRPPRPGSEGSRQRPPTDRPARKGPERERGAVRTEGRRPRPESPAAARPRPKRLQPGRMHRDAVLATLAPEERPVAEQVLRGGIPSVRQAVEEQNAKARSTGVPEVKADALVTLAESLLPRLRAAEWRDRAEAAVAGAADVSLRDLRAVVAGSDAAGRDDESRALVTSLKEALEGRSAQEREAWVHEIRGSLGDGRVVRALRVSGRPPEPGVPFPPDLAAELGAAAGAAMTADTAADRWGAVLDAVVASPVRRTVQPQGIPADRGEDLERALRLAAPRVPALAAMLGGVRPPAPRPPRPAPPGPPAQAGSPTPAREEEPAPPSGDDGNDPVLVEELG
jgi:hypothetical protein